MLRVTIAPGKCPIINLGLLVLLLTLWSDTRRRPSVWSWAYEKWLPSAIIFQVSNGPHSNWTGLDTTDIILCMSREAGTALLTTGCDARKNRSIVRLQEHINHQARTFLLHGLDSLTPCLRGAIGHRDSGVAHGPATSSRLVVNATTGGNPDAPVICSHGRQHTAGKISAGAMAMKNFCEYFTKANERRSHGGFPRVPDELCIPLIHPDGV